MTNFTGTIVPVAYVPLDQNRNVIEGGNGVVVRERLQVLSGTPPTPSLQAAAPKNGVFIDLQTIPDGDRTSLKQVVTVIQGNTRFQVGPNEITKDGKARQITVKVLRAKKL